MGGVSSKSRLRFAIEKLAKSRVASGFPK